MSVQFYDVKSRQKVMVDDSNIKKTKYTRQVSTGTQTRYALRGEYQGRMLTKFVGQADWDKMNYPVV